MNCKQHRAEIRRLHVISTATAGTEILKMYKELFNMAEDQESHHCIFFTTIVFYQINTSSYKYDTFLQDKLTNSI